MAAWLLVIMIAWYTPRTTPLESAEAMRDRFERIAQDVATTVERDDPIAGLTREQTAALMLSVSLHESSWRVDVDYGHKRSELGAVCIMQLLGRVPREAATDRLVCLREGLKRLKQSWAVCSRGPETRRLAAYATGNCSEGLKESEAMIVQWRRWLAAHPPPRRVAAR